MYYLLWYIFSYLVCHFVYQHKWFIEQTYIFCPVDVSTTEARENIILQPIHKVSLCFYNPHSHPCGCYGVTNGRKPSLLIAGGLHHTFWGEFKFLFCGPKHQLINVCYLITKCTFSLMCQRALQNRKFSVIRIRPKKKLACLTLQSPIEIVVYT